MLNTRVLRSFGAACNFAHPAARACWAVRRFKQPKVCTVRAVDDEEREGTQAIVMEQVEASATLIDSMMQEISRELFLGAAVSHVTDEAEPTSSPAAVVAQAVDSRLEEMGESFLGTLDAFIQGASERGAQDVAEVLLMVRDEVLRRLGLRLPPEMQLLDAALAAQDSKERMQLLKQYALLSPDQVPLPAEASEAGTGATGSSGNGGGFLHCLAADLERAASQVINDMELMVQVPDRRLLAKLVLLREEVQQMMEEAAFLGSMSSSEGAAPAHLPFRQLGAVPTSCAAFVQRLIALPSSQERRALLEWALRDDVERTPVRSASRPAGTGDPAPPPTNFERLREEVEKPQDWVRPGRFLQSLNALQQEMLSPTANTDSEGGSGPAGPIASDEMLERIEGVRRDTLAVLLELAGEGQPFLP